MWILLSLLAGVGDTMRDATAKYGATRIPRPMVTWSFSLCALPYFLPILLWQAPPELPLEFWFLALTMGVVHVLGGLGLTYALATTDLSLCIPMIAFTPVFLLVVGPFMNGHIPSAHAIFGTLLVTVGCYLLNISDIRRGLFGPIKALARDKGVRMMLVLSLLWSFSAAVDLNAVRMYGLSFWGAAEITAVALVFTPIAITKGAYKNLPKGTWRILALIGFGNALSFGPYLMALHSTPALYVVCLKRSNIFFSLVAGRLFFGEDSLHGRLLGATLMFAGVCVISLWG